MDAPKTLATLPTRERRLGPGPRAPAPSSARTC